MTDRRRPFSPPDAVELSGIRKLCLRMANVPSKSLDDEELDALDWLELSVLGSAEKCRVVTVDPDEDDVCIADCPAEGEGWCNVGAPFRVGLDECEPAPEGCPLRDRGTVLLRGAGPWF